MGVEQNNKGTTGTVGVGLAGAHGTLTIDANGHYIYTRTSSGTNLHLYDPGRRRLAVERDADDDRRQATPGNIIIPQVGIAGAGTLVDEAGLAPASDLGGQQRDDDGDDHVHLAPRRGPGS